MASVLILTNFYDDPGGDSDDDDVVLILTNFDDDPDDDSVNDDVWLIRACFFYIGKVFTNSFIFFFAWYSDVQFFTDSGVLFHTLMASLMHVLCVSVEFPISIGLSFFSALVTTR